MYCNCIYIYIYIYIYQILTPVLLNHQVCTSRYMLYCLCRCTYEFVLLNITLTLTARDVNANTVPTSPASLIASSASDVARSNARLWNALFCDRPCESGVAKMRMPWTSTTSLHKYLCQQKYRDSNSILQYVILYYSIYRQLHKQRYRHIYRHIYRHLYRHIHIDIYIQTYMQIV